MVAKEAWKAFWKTYNYGNSIFIDKGHCKYYCLIMANAYGRALTIGEKYACQCREKEKGTA